MTDGEGELLLEHTKRNTSFWLFLPLAAIVLSAAMVFVPALEDYVKLHREAHGAKLIRIEQFEIPTDHLFRTAAWMSAFGQEGAITFLNAPGHFLYLMTGLLVGRSSHWSPAFLGPAIWRDISFPLCAFPAWFFLGRAIDAYYASARLRRLDLTIGLVLFSTFLMISIGLRFGISAEERAEQDVLFSCYVYGFAMWAGLMLIPVAVWIMQRYRSMPAK